MAVLTSHGCVDMILHVRDAETDELVRKLARARGLSITEAVREAVEQALASDEARESLWGRTADIRSRFSSFPKTGRSVDKRFFDELSGQEDE